MGIVDTGKVRLFDPELPFKASHKSGLFFFKASHKSGLVFFSAGRKTPELL